MPLVFVHGVATRQSAVQKTRALQRDALFRNLVLPSQSKVFDPDWGSNAATLSPGLPWLPIPGNEEAFGGQGAEGTTNIGHLASKNPELAIDLVFQAALTAEANAAVQAERSLGKDKLAAFESAVRYLEAGPDKDVFDAKATDSAFLSTLSAELQAHGAGKSDSEPMGLASEALRWLSGGLKEIVAPISNTTSDAILRLVRRPMSEQVALFLGDIFVYLRWREADGQQGSLNRILNPIIESISEASKIRSTTDPLVIVGHSLGGVILVDLLSDRRAVDTIEKASGSTLVVDTLVTVGSQVGLFADLGLYAFTAGMDGLKPRPACVSNWMNVYDYTDVLAFGCERVFQNVEDYEFDNVSGLFSAHSAYFQRPSFYKRLRERLKNGPQA